MVDKIKVLYIITRCMKSGPIRVLEGIIKNIDLNKFEIYMISINPENEARSILADFKRMVKYEYVPVSKFEVLLGKLNALKLAVDKIKPDVIHTTGVIPDYIGNRLFHNIQITIAHANDTMEYCFQYGKLMGTILAKWHVGVMRNAKQVIACSKSLSEIYQKEENLEMSFIRNGVDYLEFQTRDKYGLRKRLGLPESKFIMVYAASFNVRKNHRFILDAMADSGTIPDNVVLLLLGDGPTFQELRDEYSRYQNVIFKGRVRNVFDYMAASDCFFSPSLQEGMPMGVLEALNIGLPVILSNIPQHKEILDLNPDIGFIYEEKSDDLAECILELQKRDLEKLGKAANQVIKKYCNSVSMSEEYQKEYQKIAKG